jgi:GNAT superfamily N-acetyltransferase
MIGVLSELFEMEKVEVNIENIRKAYTMLINDRENACVKVVFVDGELAGMCQAQTYVSTSAGSRVAYIEDMVIHSRFRRLGLGARLLEAVEDCCRRLGCFRLMLHTLPDNAPAMKFYIKNGWSPEDLVCMSKPL